MVDIKKLKVGDRVKVTNIAAESGNGERIGHVVYIHPKNIYATVNIRGLYNECFFANEISFIGE